MEQIEDLKRAIQFPTLEPPPADFLAQMEGYCREAPRPLDEHAHKKARPALLSAGFSSSWAVFAGPPMSSLGCLRSSCACAITFCMMTPELGNILPLPV